MSLIRGFTDEIKMLTANANLGAAKDELLNTTLDRVGLIAKTPMLLSASFPTADALLNIGSSQVEAGDGGGKSVPPIDDTIPTPTAVSTINFQTGAIVGQTVLVDGSTFALPTGTVGRYRRYALVLRNSGDIDSTFSIESLTVNGLTNAGDLLKTLTNVTPGLPIGWIDLECDNVAGTYRTAGSATAIIENKVGSTNRIFRFGAGGGGGASKSNLDAEISARLAADSTLTSNLNSEVTSRLNGDSTLTSNLNSEITSRLNGDSTLQNNLNSEITSRLNGDSTLTANLNSEITARLDGDSTLQSNLDSETTSRLLADSTLTSNLNSEITARLNGDSTLQSNLNSEITSRLNGDSTLQANLNSEITSRLNGDSTLTSNLNLEVTARIDGDSTLQANLNSEITARMEADSSLMTIGGDVSFEVTARMNADSTLQANINSEITARLNGDSTLQANLNSEITSRLNGDSTLQSNLNSEITARLNGDSTLTANLNSEITARLDGDSTLTANLDAEITARLNGDSTLTANLNSEITARIDGDSTLQANINTEKTSRLNADSTLTANLNSEITARLNGDSTLQSNLDSETTSRVLADSTLTSNLNSEITARIDGDSTLQANINTEKTSRLNADSTLQANLNSETTSRENADSTLQSNIDSETTSRLLADSTLTANLNTEKTTRLNADSTLQSNLDSEMTSRLLADSTLTANLNSEITSRLNGDSTLTANLNSEITSRLNGDSTLTANLNSEITARSDADSTLTANLNSEITSRVNGDSTLQSNLNSEITARLSADSSINAVGIGNGNGTTGSGTIGANNLKVDLGALTATWDATAYNISVKTPTSPAHAVTKAYADQLALTGGVIKEALLTDYQLKSGSGAGILAAEVIYFNTNPSSTDFITIKNGATTETFTFVVSRSTAFEVTIGTLPIDTMTNLASAINTDSVAWLSHLAADGLDAINTAGVVVVIDKATGAGASTSRIFGTWTTQADARVVEFYDLPEYRTSKTNIELPLADPAAGRFGLNKLQAALVDGEIHVCLENDTLRSWHVDALNWLTLSGSGSLPDATAGSGGATKGKITFDTDLGLDINSGVGEVKIDNSTIKFNLSGQLYADAGTSNAEETARMNADSTLQANINSEITARLNGDSTLQSNLDAEITSRLNGDSTLQSNLNSEITARLNGDSTLTANLNSEITARLNGDSTLTANLNSEITARLDGDSTLQANLNSEITARLNGDSTLQANLNLEITARSDADTTLQSNINTEKTSRLNADSTLTANLNSEITARLNGDSTLQANLDSETTSRVLADSTLTSNLNSEITARIDGDSTLQANINTEKTSRLNADSTLTANLNSEITSRENADSTLQANLDSETTARVLADSTLSSNYNSEMTSRLNADSTLTANLNSEITSRLNGDSTLQSNLNSEITARLNGDSTLQSNLNSEITARLDGDSTLQSNLNLEITARSDADSTLQSNLNSEITSRLNGDSTLQSNLNSEITSRLNGDSTLQSNLNTEITARINADFALQAAAFNIGSVAADGTIVIKGGFIALNNDGVIATYSGSGTTEASFGNTVDLTFDLDTLEASPVNNTPYYLYVDTYSLPSYITLTDTGRNLIPVVSTNFVLLTQDFETVYQYRYVKVGVVRRAVGAWSTTASTYPIKKQMFPNAIYSPTVYTNEQVIGNVGDVGQINSGHVLTSSSFPSTYYAADVSFYNLNGLTDGNTSLAHDLTNNGSTPFTGTGIMGVASSCASFNGTSQWLNSTDAHFNPSAVDWIMGGWFKPTSYTPAAAQTLFSSWAGGGNQKFRVDLTTIGDIKVYSSTTGANATSTTFTWGTGSGWNHIALQYVTADQKLYLYIDSVLMGEHIVGAALYTPASPDFALGAVAGGSSYYDGLIDEFYASNGYGFADDEITKTYSSKITRSTSILPKYQDWKAIITYGDISAQLLDFVTDADEYDVYMDMSGQASTASVYLTLCNTSYSGNSNVSVSRIFEGTAAQIDALGTFSHNLPSMPTALSLMVDVGSGFFEYQDASAYFKASLTQLAPIGVTDLTTSFGASTNVKLLASVGPAAVYSETPAWTTRVKVADYSVMRNEEILADSTSGAFNITLLASPRLGDRCRILDQKGTWSTNNVTMLRNGNKITGLATDLVLDVDKGWAELVFDGVDNWVLIAK